MTGSMWRSPPAPTACMSGRRTWRPKTRGGCSAPAPSSASRSTRWRSRRAAPLDLIDYAGVGGVYGTTSKAQKNQPIGPAGLRAIVEALHRRKGAFPTCGIAGINASNAAEVIAAGADGVSIISALSLADDPKEAARALRGIVDRALAQRGRS